MERVGGEQKIKGALCLVYHFIGNRNAGFFVAIDMVAIAFKACEKSGLRNS